MSANKGLAHCLHSVAVPSVTTPALGMPLFATGPRTMGKGFQRVCYQITFSYALKGSFFVERIKSRGTEATVCGDLEVDLDAPFSAPHGGRRSLAVALRCVPLHGCPCTAPLSRHCLDSGSCLLPGSHSFLRALRRLLPLGRDGAFLNTGATHPT